MAVDPWIARGAPPVDITNTLAQIAQLKQRDRAVATAEERTRNDAARQDREDAEDADEEARFDRALAAGDWVTAARIDPAATALIRKVNGLDKEDGLKVGALDPGDWEPGSVDAARASGKLGDLVRYVAPTKPEQYAPAGHREVTVIEDGKPVAYMVNERDPSKRVRIGEAPGKSSSEPREPKLFPDGYGGYSRLDEQGRLVPVPTAEAGAAPAAATPAASKAPAKDRATSKSGRPIVWRNGQWEYEQQGAK